MRNTQPIISFTFDDFPRSALRIGGRILKSEGLLGTYYASLGLMGTIAPTGNIFTEADLHLLLDQGHELGCHTFEHCDASNTPSNVFKKSIVKNASVLEAIETGAVFKTLSYPIGNPRPEIKRLSELHFAACRGGGQTVNQKTIDLNLLSAFFLEQSRDDPNSVYRLIDQNARANGWLIFASHDIQGSPTRYGCEPAFFQRVVQRSLKSGARVLPVAQGLALVSGKDE